MISDDEYDADDEHKINEEIKQLSRKSKKLAEKADNIGTTHRIHIIDDKDGKAQDIEINIHKTVNDRFFRFYKQPKNDALQLINLIKSKTVPSDEMIKKFNIKDNKDYLDCLSFKNDVQFKGVIKEYLKKTISLDNYSGRAVIIALSRLLKKRKRLPIAIFRIGDTYILCVGRPGLQKGNAFLRIIDQQGNPNNNIRLDYSREMAAELGAIEDRCNINVAEEMRERSRVISSFSDIIQNNKDAILLDFTNFLRMVIEIVRRSYRGADNLTQELDQLPIGISQTRTSLLLSKNIIDISDAYGFDERQVYYKQNSLIKDYHGKWCSHQAFFKAPYGAVTGKELSKHFNEVKEKVKRINSKYNEKYNEDIKLGKYAIESRQMTRFHLGMEYGGSSESSGSDYSDEELEIKTKYVYTKECLRKLYGIGRKCLVVAENQQILQVDLSGSEAFETLCEIIDLLYRYDRDKLLYNLLAQAASPLQQRYLEEEEASTCCIL